MFSVPRYHAEVRLQRPLRRLSSRNIGPVLANLFRIRALCCSAIIDKDTVSFQLCDVYL
jgi:hypothetical protein